MKEKQELVHFRVYDRNGRYHQSYIDEDDAKVCAKHINGALKSVAEENATAELLLTLDQ